MNIAFNGINSGLGNNGGTRTLLLCQKELEEMGHRCDFIATVDNFTWFEHKQVINYLPVDLDAIVSVACSDVVPTLPFDVPKMAWYIRGHENWTMSDQDLGHLYRDPRFLNIVNSKGLQRMLDRQFHASSVVVYQGIEMDKWQDRKIRADKIRIGCLSNKRHPTKRWEDFSALAETLGHDDYEYVAFGLEPRDDDFLTKFLQSPSHDDLVDLYSSCHIWFAPTELEGLHNPAIEASLCGCLLVANDNPMNGMILDYAFDKDTAMIYRARDIEHAAQKIRTPNWDLVQSLQQYMRSVIGTRRDNMKKMVGYLEAL